MFIINLFILLSIKYENFVILNAFSNLPLDYNLRAKSCSK